jgi:hypothetical protein
METMIGECHDNWTIKVYFFLPELNVAPKTCSKMILFGANCVIRDESHAQK